jgi:hypothetical protein
MKRVIAAIIFTTTLFAGTVTAQAPNNYTYTSKKVTVNGKTYNIKYCIVDGAKAPVEITLGLARQRLFFRDDPEKIASFEGAVCAMTGAYHNESGGWSNYLFDSHYIVNGKAVRIFNGGSNFCATNDGKWLWGRLRFKVQGRVQEKLQPPSLMDVFVSGVNQPPSASSTTYYTSEWGSKVPNTYASTCVVIEKGVVTNVTTGPVAIPKNGVVLMYTGANRDRCSKTRWPKGYIRKGLHINLFWKAEPGNNVDLNTWRNSKIVFGGSPTVVKDGKAYWNLSEDKSYNPDALSYAAQRAAFGIDGKGKAFFVTFQDAISIREEGPVMVALGARHAFNLDGGCSAFLYFDGKIQEENCRQLPAVIIARPKK